MAQAAAAVRDGPQNPVALAALAEALHREGHCEAALTVLDRAWHLDADRTWLALAEPALLVHAAVRLGQAECYEAALAALDRAVAADPTLVRAWSNRGVALCKLGRFAEALAATRTATRLDPDCAEARFGSAVALLALGDWPEAFRHYEARWELPGATPPTLESPRWQGEALPGARLLVLGEQGFGDMLQFARFVPLAAARVGEVVLQVPRPLHRLLAPLAKVHDLAGPAPPHDVHCPLMSLPGVLGLWPATVPPAPYLRADADAAAAWRERLPRNGPRVGLVWSGGGRRVGAITQQPDGGRSVPAAALAPLAATGASFVSLQLGGTPPFPMLDPTAELRDFADTAALMEALDLVISVDTAALHLAGALGGPVWLLRRFARDWRFPGGERSHWYGSLRIFAQPCPGDWATPVRRMVAALRQ